MMSSKQFGHDNTTLQLWRVPHVEPVFLLRGWEGQKLRDVQAAALQVTVKLLHPPPSPAWRYFTFRCCFVTRCRGRGRRLLCFAALWHAWITRCWRRCTVDGLWLCARWRGHWGPLPLAQELHGAEAATALFLGCEALSFRMEIGASLRMRPSHCPRMRPHKQIRLWAPISSARCLSETFEGAFVFAGRLRGVTLCCWMLKLWAPGRRRLGPLGDVSHAMHQLAALFSPLCFTALPQELLLFSNGNVEHRCFCSNRGPWAVPLGERTRGSSG